MLSAALENLELDRPPIWFMRQAGRYLPEYQSLRAKHTFMQIVKTPELATEITLQPIKRFDLDAAIIFSDILIILEAIGFEVSFANGPPELDRTLTTESDLKLVKKNYSKEKLWDQLSYYQQSLSLTRQELTADKDLIGFAAAPFTLASYLIEGETSKFHAKARAAMYGRSDFFYSLLDFITEITIDYLEMQVASGANVIQVFDSWADVVPPESYSDILIPFNLKIASSLKKIIKDKHGQDLPMIFFCRGASVHREHLLALYQGYNALSIDWRLPIDFFGDKPVQGNLDPAMLFSDPDTVAEHSLRLLNTRGKRPGFIFNLGHGIYPGAHLENVEAMVKTVQNF